MILAPLLLAAATWPDLRLEVVRESLTGTHYRYRQVVGGVPVAGGEVNVTVRPDGAREETRALAKGTARRAAAYVNVNGELRPARLEGERRYVDIETGHLIREELPFANAKTGRVFLANPVEKLNDPSLQDQNNAASAVPDAAYSTIDVPRIREAGSLGGTWAQIVDTQPPAVTPADASQPLVFDRSQSGFEDVNAYVHVDSSQEYVRSLGYTGARAIAPYAVEIDTHAANGADASFYLSGSIAGRGALFFGDGGVDDAEDPDLVVHEYAHVLHDWIAPNTYLGAYSSQARAISEGFGDYWAFSSGYERSLQSGRDPFCFADWDPRCANDASSERCGYTQGVDCLRRLDGNKTVADFVLIDTPGTEHRNGEIWSSALREIFVAMVQRYGLTAGKRATDTIVLESLFGPPPNPGFATIAKNMIVADRYLNAGANGNVICAAMISRGILSDCAAMPRGELTYVQGPDRGVPIPDNHATGITVSTTVSDPRLIERVFVAVDVAHTARGDLRISLIAPDGTEVLLQSVSLDVTDDIHAIFGRDAIPSGSLDALRGRPAAGEWRLRIADLRNSDVGALLSWALVFQFAADGPLATRPTGGVRQTVPVVGRLPGGNGTFYVTDVRLLNRKARDVGAALIYTPAGANGTTDFGAVNVIVPPGEVVAFDDVVGRAFGTAGRGQLEIVGDLLVTTRTYNATERGTFGQRVPPAEQRNLARRSGPTMFLPRFENSSAFRTNVGFAETEGRSGKLRLKIDASTNEYEIGPYGQLQVPVAVQGRDLTGAVDVVSGEPVVAAYASIIDNRSGDAVFLPAQMEGLSRDVVAPVISAGGALATAWRSDVWFMGVPVSILPVFIPTAFIDVQGQATQVRIGAPGGVRAVQYDDVIESLYHRAPSRGVMVAGLPAVTFAGSRTWTSGPDGTYGQYVPFAAPSGSAASDVFVESSDSFRTNIGLISDVATVVRVTILDAGGRELSHSEHALTPYVVDQFPVRERVINGRAHIELLQGRVYAYSSIVDNRSGDPTFMLAQ